MPNASPSHVASTTVANATGDGIAPSLLWPHRGSAPARLLRTRALAVRRLGSPVSLEGARLARTTPSPAAQSRLHWTRPPTVRRLGSPVGLEGARQARATPSPAARSPRGGPHLCPSATHPQLNRVWRPLFAARATPSRNGLPTLSPARTWTLMPGAERGMLRILSSCLAPRSWRLRNRTSDSPSSPEPGRPCHLTWSAHTSPLTSASMMAPFPSNGMNPRTSSSDSIASKTWTRCCTRPSTALRSRLSGTHGGGPRWLPLVRFTSGSCLA